MKQKFNQDDTKEALSGLYVAAKHKDDIAVDIYIKKLDEMGVCFKAQNYILEKASADKTPGIPGYIIENASRIAEDFVALKRIASLAPPGLTLSDAVAAVKSKGQKQELSA